MAPLAASPRLMAVAWAAPLCLFATRGEAALHRLQTSFSSGATAQIGLQMPPKDAMDFGVAGPKPLLVVESTADAQQAAKAVLQAGEAKLVIGTDAKTGRWSIRSSDEGDASWTPVAWAAYNNTVKQNGWAYLSLRATEDSAVSKDIKMYAAGFLEGLVTAGQIHDFSHNAGILLRNEEENHHAMDNIQNLFSRSLRNICNKSGMAAGAVLRDDRAASEPWWQHAGFAMVQAWGTMDGYNQRAQEVGGKRMSLIDLMVLNSDGETPELEQAYDMEESLLRQSQGSEGGENDSFIQQREQHRVGQVLRSRPGKPQLRLAQRFAAQRKRSMQNLGEAAWRTIKETSGRCSALVRLAGGNRDLMLGHATFSDYSEMNRIFKYYDFPLGADSVRRMGFSSYPGVAGSTDDYYLLDSGLAITETTVSMLSDEPYDKLQDNLTQVPDFMRIMVANRLARSGPHWAQLMTQSATGTYSSQWMVVDYNKFTPGQQLTNGTLTVIEQVPGLSHTEDESARLQAQGFWASENRAWFKGVRDSIGATEAEELHGALFSADKNPRANIFNATAPNVQSLAEMRAEMRRNRWPHEVDGGEGNSPDHAIAARGDLDADHPNANGGVDAKVTNYCLIKKLQCHAVSGPTTDSQKPFRWKDEKTGAELFPGMPHEGLPDLWNFDWVRMTPAGEAGVQGDTCA